MAKALLKTKDATELPEKETVRLVQALVGDNNGFSIDWDEVEKWAQVASKNRKTKLDC